MFHTFITQSRHPRKEGILAASSPSRDVPSREATIRRPFWFVVWASLTYATFALIPMRLPVYGDLVPAWALFGLPIEAFVLLGITAFGARRHGAHGHQLLAAALAGPLASFFFAFGAIFLLTGEFSPLGIGALGAFGLIILVTWEAAAMKADKERKPIADLFSTLFDSSE